MRQLLDQNHSSPFKVPLLARFRKARDLARLKFLLKPCCHGNVLNEARIGIYEFQAAANAYDPRLPIDRIAM